MYQKLTFRNADIRARYAALRFSLNAIALSFDGLVMLAIFTNGFTLWSVSENRRSYAIFLKTVLIFGIGFCFGVDVTNFRNGFAD